MPDERQRRWCGGRTSIGLSGCGFGTGRKSCGGRGRIGGGAGSKCRVQTFIPQTDVAIELGGEDAKITYLTGGIEQRMNGSCAGGTGAFIVCLIRAEVFRTDMLPIQKTVS